MADFDSPQQSSSTTGVERSLVDESKFGLGLQPMLVLVPLYIVIIDNNIEKSLLLSLLPSCI